MWNGLPMLLGLSALMGIASFLAGSLPLSFSMSQRKVRFISALGTGVLVGTSLIVIIPEGIETLYSAGSASNAAGHTHSDRALSSPGQKYPPLGLPTAPESDVDRWTQELRTAERNVEAIADLSDPSGWSRAAAAAAPASGGSDSTSDDPIQEGQPSQTGPGSVLPSQETRREPHAYVGLSLIFGFILMYLIDVLPSHMSGSAHPARPLHISLSNLGSGLHHSPSHSPSMYAADAAAPAGGAAKSNPPATTIGLVIHAAADGIALGASSTAASTKLGFIVFLAIMVHKAPAAFGLTSVLLKQGLSKRLARAHLLVFSLAAPIGALGTWAAVNIVGRDTLGGEEGMQFATGCVLLFSGGTFLYVAMHSMQDSASSTHAHARSRPISSSGLSNGFADNSLLEQGFGNGEKGGPTAAETIVACLGMLVPLVTQVGHHAH